MRNEEKRALRRELRGRRSQMGRDVRAAATVKINRLLKRYIKHGRKIGVYWPMGKELRLDGFVRAAQNFICLISNRVRGGCGLRRILKAEWNGSAYGAGRS